MGVGVVALGAGGEILSAGASDGLGVEAVFFLGFLAATLAHEAFGSGGKQKGEVVAGVCPAVGPELV